MGLFTATSTLENELIPFDGLVAWYDASNRDSYPGTGTSWYDLSDKRGVGTLVGSPTFNLGTGLFTFNGSTQRVDLTQFLDSGQPTYSYYAIMSSTNNGTTMVFGQATEANNRRALIIRLGGYYGFNGYNNDANTPSNMNIGNNVLTSVGLSMNTKASNQNQAVRFFRNGSFATTSGTGGGATNLNMGTSAKIAANGGNGELFNGSIGVCMAWNRAITDDEMAKVNQYYRNKYTLA
jgi:hypothetical protein